MDYFRKVGAAIAATGVMGLAAASGVFPLFCLAAIVSVSLLCWAAD